MEYKYFFGNCSLSIQSEKAIEEEHAFQIFRREEEKMVNCKIRFLPCEELPSYSGKDCVTEKDVSYSEYMCEGEFIRTFHGLAGGEPYALLKKEDERTWICFYREDYSRYFKTMNEHFSHIALERILLDQDAAILHASFIRLNKEGILFTGISGAGKSTQAELWRKYEKAEILNGDKTILKKMNGNWIGFGSPYAGSSKIWKNDNVRIKAIVALGKSASNNECKRLTGGKAFSVIYSGMIMNTWNSEYMGKITEMIREISIEIPIFYLNCKVEKGAVECLKESLEKLEN